MERLQRCSYCGAVVIVPELSSRPAEAAQVGRAPFTSLEMNRLLAQLLRSDQLARLGEITHLARQGERDEAMVRYLQLFGGKRRDAEAVVEILGAGDEQQGVETLASALQPELHPARRPLSPAEVEIQVREYLAAGERPRAILCYRQAFAVSLAEARDRIDQLERGGSFLAPDGMQMAGGASIRLASGDVLVQAAQLARQDQKAAAVRMLREAFDLRLGVAEELVVRLASGESLAEADIDMAVARANREARRQQESLQAQQIVQHATHPGGRFWNWLRSLLSRH